MVSLVEAVSLLVIVGVHTLFAAVATRFFRIRLDTGWGTLVYVAFVIPIVLFLSMLFFTGTLGLGPNLGSTELIVMVMIVLPVVLGYTIDVFWMPHPDEIELPDTAD